MENAAIGFRKAQPLRVTGQRAESVPLAHWLSVRYRLPDPGPFAWVNAYLERSLAAVVADRHLLHASEVHDCISYPPGTARRPGQRDRGLTRRLPVAILRQFLSSAASSSSSPSSLLEQLAQADPSRIPSARALADALELGVRSFEGSLALLAAFVLQSASWDPDVRQARFRGLALDFYTAVVQQRDPYWQGVPMPRDVQALSESAFADAGWLRDRGRLLWFACHWRCHLAYCLRSRWHNVLRQSPAYAAFGTPLLPHWLPHQSQLWADTHLDLMTYAVRTQRWQDAVLLADPLVVRFYPAANHVLCDGELPDATALFTQADLWYEMHVKKEPRSLTRAVTHILLSKALNFQNQIRGFWSQLRLSMAQLPEFDALVKLILHTHLLGNSPLSRSHLWMAARLRIHALFLFPQTLDAHVKLTPADIAQLPKKDKPLERQHPRTVLHDWIIERNGLVYMLVREWMLYTLAQLPWLDGALGRTPSHFRFKELVFECLRDCRDHLSQQARQRPGAPFDWDVLVRYTNPAKGKNPQGLVAIYHDQGLKHNVKVRKGHFEELLLKKITNCKKDLQPKPPEDLETLPPPLGPSEDDFHMVCWWLALHGPRVLDVRYFTLLGMTFGGVDMLALWISDYYVHDFRDNQLLNMLLILYERCPRDLVILMRALQLILRYRQDRPFYLSRAALVHQLCAIRQHTFALDPLEDTPDECDLRWYCEGCEKWANHVVTPPDWAFKVTPVRPGAPLTSSVRYCVPYRGYRPPTQLEPSAKQKLVSTASIYNAVFNPLTGRMHCADAQGASPRVARVLDMASGEDTPEAGWDPEADEQALTDVFADDADEAITNARLEALAGLVALGEGPVPAGKKRRRKSRRTTQPRMRETPEGRALVNAAQGPLNRHFTCNRPLTQVNMAAMWIRGVGLCAYCGGVTAVQNEKMTTRGLNCMHHCTPEFTAEHPVWYHAHCTRPDAGGAGGAATSAHAARFNALPAIVNLSKQLRRGTNGSCPPLVQTMLQPRVRDRPACAVCRRMTAKFFVLFYDEATLRLHLVPLCRYEHIETDVLHGRRVLSLQTLWIVVRESILERRIRERTT